MVGKLISRIRNLTLALCVSICGALLGGFLFLILFGTGNTNTEVLSLVLWVLTIASPKRNYDDDITDE